MGQYEGKIETYSLNLNSGDGSEPRVIHLRGDFGMTFVHLMPEGVERPQNSHRKEGVDQFYVHLVGNDWGPLVDMLRYESPVNFFYSDETRNAGIFTDREIVGEGNE